MHAIFPTHIMRVTGIYKVVELFAFVYALLYKLHTVLPNHHIVVGTRQRFNIFAGNY